MSGVLILMANGAVRVVLTNRTITALDSELVSPSASAAATYRLNADGTLEFVMTGNSSSPSSGLVAGEWLVGSSDGSLYEAFATLNSGTLNTGTTGAWLDCATSPSWRCSATRGTIGSTTQTANLTIQIRDKATSTVRATATITITATAEFDA